MNNFLKKNWIWLVIFTIGGFIFFMSLDTSFKTLPMHQSMDRVVEVGTKTTDPWKEKLTREEYDILRNKGTELPYSSNLLREKRKGTYYAVDTKEPVFRSEDKYDSGTGWPSFTKPIKPDAVREAHDTEFGISRTEVLTTAGGHLGHVFTDGPEPTGLRYCMNGKALYFVPDDK
jgi:methionine-R-sulfoxide reductase